MMTKHSNFRVGVVLTLAASLTIGAATPTLAEAKPRSEVDKAIGKCIGAVAIGAILGGVIGNNTGNGNAKRGATQGAVLGAGVCVVLLAMASQRDKQAIADAQMQSAQTGLPQKRDYVGSDGLRRSISVTSQDVAPPPSAAAQPSPPRICRRLNTTLEVEGKGSTDVGGDIVCRNDDNTWTRA